MGTSNLGSLRPTNHGWYRSMKTCLHVDHQLKKITQFDSYYRTKQGSRRFRTFMKNITPEVYEVAFAQPIVKANGSKDYGVKRIDMAQQLAVASKNIETRLTREIMKMDLQHIVKSRVNRMEFHRFDNDIRLEGAGPDIWKRIIDFFNPKKRKSESLMTPPTNDCQVSPQRLRIKHNIIPC